MIGVYPSGLAKSHPSKQFRSARYLLLPGPSVVRLSRYSWDSIVRSIDSAKSHAPDHNAWNATCRMLKCLRENDLKKLKNFLTTPICGTCRKQPRPNALLLGTFCPTIKQGSSRSLQIACFPREIDPALARRKGNRHSLCAINPSDVSQSQP